MNGPRLRRHSRPKELQTRRIPWRIWLRRPPIPYYHLRLILTRLCRPILLHHNFRLPVFPLLVCIMHLYEHASSLRSSMHSSSRNPSPSRQNGSRPRGAPYLPHIRNTLEIVLPQSLTPISFSDHTGYGGVSSVIVDTRRVLRIHGRGQRSLVHHHTSTSPMTIRLPNHSVCCNMLLGDVVPDWHAIHVGTFGVAKWGAASASPPIVV